MKCIKYLRQDKIVRVSEKEANDLIEKGEVFYVPKSIYKEYIKADALEVSQKKNKKELKEQIQKEIKERRKLNRKLK